MAGGVRSDDAQDEELSEINVTPFIDVMLVLLIIFMVAAPLSTVDLPVELPVSAAASKPKPDKPTYLSLKQDLGLAIGEQVVSRHEFISVLSSLTEGKKETRLFLRADRTVPYGEVMNVMNILSRAGYLKIGLVGLEDAAAAQRDAGALK